MNSLDNNLGYDGSQWLNDLWQFHIASQRWTCIQESSDAGPADEASSLMGDMNRPQHAVISGAAVASSALGKSRHVRGKVPSRRFGYVSVVHAGKLVRILLVLLRCGVETSLF